MSKNVLVISASPRKGGNSDTLCDEFIRGAQESGNHAEKIFLASKNIEYCIGCGVCNTTHKCVQKDDMAEILDKMVDADVIVLATPVYFYTMSAQLKTVIDRTLGAAQQPGLENKEFYLIATAADGKAEMERTIDGLRGYLECLPGAREKGIIYGAGAWQMGDIRRNPALEEAWQMGKNA